jgi:PTH1 family peptidyl-tRNA hydrolase
MIKMVVGLGNPGTKYEYTRHNAGFLTLDRLAELRETSWKNWHSCAEISRLSSPDVILVKPQTYMNNSGLAVKSLSDYFHIAPEEILVVVDDFSLPLGSVRARSSGSAGGHNGLASIIEHLGSSSFPRLRLGIGPLPAGCDSADFVLSPFKHPEREMVRAMIDQAVEVIGNIAAVGWDKAVSKLPAKNSTP